MRSRSNQLSRAQKSKSLQEQGPNWVLVVGGALLSTISIHLMCKLKHAVQAKQQETWGSGNLRPNESKKAAGCHVHSNIYLCTQDEDGCFNDVSEDTECTAEMVYPENENGDISIASVAPPQYNRESRLLWASPDHLEVLPKPFHSSNCLDSPQISESGSDVFSKREVINKLRQQIKRRDEMILEMQNQIIESQDSFNSQLAYASHLQSQLDSVNKDLFKSDIEIQLLRKAITNHCHAQFESDVRPSTLNASFCEMQNRNTNEYPNNIESSETGGLDNERIKMLQKEVCELKELLEGKNYLLQSYKGQKAELSTKIEEMQQRLDSQIPYIL